tara:strand:+ start:965 stop:2518 length:1554 start_codon:yes stop_codon:yes gene_type:complete
MADDPKKPAPKKKKKGRPFKLNEKNLLGGKFGEEAKGVAQLAAVIKELNLTEQNKKTDIERNQKLEELIKTTKRGDKEGKENILALKKEFSAAQERLSTAVESGDEKQIALEERNIASLDAATGDVEKQREAAKASEKQNKLLEGIKGGIGNLATKFKDNAGFLAGLAGVALAVFNPEKLKEIIDRTIGTIVDAYNIIEALFTGDFKGALEIFKDNWKDISIGLGLVVALNFGKVVKAITIVKNGMMGIQAAMAAAGIGLGPAVLIGIAIGVIIAALVKTFEKMKATFEETGSIFETFKAGLIEFPAQLLGIPLDLIKKAISYVAGLFGFDTTAIDAFSFTDMYRSIFTSMFDGIEFAITYVKELFMSAITKAPEIFNSITAKLEETFQSIADKFSQLKVIIKAFGAGALAAIKAAAPGGESPSEAYNRVYAEVISSGKSTDVTDKMEVTSDNTGEELDVSSVNKSASERGQRGRNNAPITVTNVDNSSRSNSNTSVVSGRSGRNKGFGVGTEAAYA